MNTQFNHILKPNKTKNKREKPKWSHSVKWLRVRDVLENHFPCINSAGECEIIYLISFFLLSGFLVRRSECMHFLFVGLNSTPCAFVIQLHRRDSIMLHIHCCVRFFFYLLSLLLSIFLPLHTLLFLSSFLLLHSHKCINMAYSIFMLLCLLFVTHLPSSVLFIFICTFLQQIFFAKKINKYNILKETKSVAIFAIMCTIIRSFVRSVGSVWTMCYNEGFGTLQ